MPIGIEHRISKNGKLKAFTLVEALVVLSIFLIMTTSFYRIFAAGTNWMAESKKRILATGVASEKMENIRGMEYGLIGTQGGTPSGAIDPDEYVVSSGQRFHVKIYIVYVDDSDDGAGASDPAPNDYKNVQVDVLWGEELESQKVSFSSSFSPSGTEADVGGGILSVSVIDAIGAPISNANVNIYNNHISPILNANYSTSSAGTVSIVGAKASGQYYEITVSKGGYETTSTLSPYPQTSYYPTNTHVAVIENMVSNSVISIGKLSNLKISFQDPYLQSIGDVNFSMSGGRVMGNNADGSPVYNYSASSVSDADGVKELNDMSPGNYKFIIDEPGYTLWKGDSDTGNDPDEISLPQGESLYNESITLLDNNIDSCFLKVVDEVTGHVIDSATVTLKNDSLGYSEDEGTDQYGDVFFPIDQLKVLTNGATYDVKVTASGYEDNDSTITINKLTQKTISLTPQ